MDELWKVMSDKVAGERQGGGGEDGGTQVEARLRRKGYAIAKGTWKDRIAKGMFRIAVVPKLALQRE